MGHFVEEPRYSFSGLLPLIYELMVPVLESIKSLVELTMLGLVFIVFLEELVVFGVKRSNRFLEEAEGTLGALFL